MVALVYIKHGITKTREHSTIFNVLGKKMQLSKYCLICSLPGIKRVGDKSKKNKEQFSCYLHAFIKLLESVNISNKLLETKESN